MHEMHNHTRVECMGVEKGHRVLMLDRLSMLALLQAKRSGAHNIGQSTAIAGLACLFGLLLPIVIWPQFTTPNSYCRWALTEQMFVVWAAQSGHCA